MGKDENEAIASKIMQVLQDAIFALQQNQAETMGQTLYRPNAQSSFKQCDIYELAGKNDNVATLQFRKGSESSQLYGENLTVCFEYTLKERQALVVDKNSLNDELYVKAKDLLCDLGEDERNRLATKGILLEDIVEMVVSPSVNEHNTFTSNDKRDIKTLKVEMSASSIGGDITWMYGFLKKMKNKGVALTPEENADYLAYKLVLDKASLTDEEKSRIFDEKGALKDNDVSLAYLLWKKQAKLLKGNDMENLIKLQIIKNLERFKKTADELKKMGLSWEKLAEISKDKALLLYKRVTTFREVRYNVTGKNLLYCNFDSFLHVYLRHVEDLKVSNQFENRDKFQLHEEDVMIVMGHVMEALNDEYQKYKNEHPDGRFYRAGKMAYYYNGDYYNVYVNSDGSISTFYKGSGNFNANKQ